MTANALRDHSEPARVVVERHREALKLMECGDRGVLYDMDRQTDIAT